MSTLAYEPPAQSARRRLFAMTPCQREGAYRRGEMSLAEMNCWASFFPEEVPLVNGELPWIVATLADAE